eukprot:TRINITY_DN23855_c1_g1_i3.p1 TRINITY_DN23855_c1_g1~~TRINITY_DN23855_c1_g1_i3.p1  ORF type:complete len:417 (-),score=107.33 TRINITY_DN23855_c1_g1_i3:154-1404(-)
MQAARDLLRRQQHPKTKHRSASAVAASGDDEEESNDTDDDETVAVMEDIVGKAVVLELKGEYLRRLEEIVESKTPEEKVLGEERIMKLRHEYLERLVEAVEVRIAKNTSVAISILREDEITPLQDEYKRNLQSAVRELLEQQLQQNDTDSLPAGDASKSTKLASGREAASNSSGHLGNSSSTRAILDPTWPNYVYLTGVTTLESILGADKAQELRQAYLHRLQTAVEDTLHRKLSYDELYIGQKKVFQLQDEDYKNKLKIAAAKKVQLLRHIQQVEESMLMQMKKRKAAARAELAYAAAEAAVTSRSITFVKQVPNASRPGDGGVLTRVMNSSKEVVQEFDCTLALRTCRTAWSATKNFWCCSTLNTCCDDVIQGEENITTQSNVIQAALPKAALPSDRTSSAAMSAVSPTTTGPP